MRPTLCALLLAERTVHCVSTPIANAELNAALEPLLVSTAGRQLCSVVLGLFGLADLAPLDPVTHPVSAFLTDETEDMMRIFVVTPAWFGFAEMNTAEDTLSILVPVSRVSRIAESVISGVQAITIEIDADVKRTQAVAEFSDTLVLNEENQPTGARLGRLNLGSETRSSVYEIITPVDTPEAAAARHFALGLRATLTWRP